MDCMSGERLHRSMKRFCSLAHYANSKTNPNSNAPVLTNGGTVVQVPVVGVIGRETRGGALQGELCSPRVTSRLMNSVLTKFRTSSSLSRSFHRSRQVKRGKLRPPSNQRVKSSRAILRDRAVSRWDRPGFPFSFRWFQPLLRKRRACLSS
jgi:hypothetical protein